MPFKQHPDNPDLVIYKTNEYCVPKPWVGLTDEERSEMIGRISHDHFTTQRELIESTQIITEMYLREKNCTRQE